MVASFLAVPGHLSIYVSCSPCNPLNTWRISLVFSPEKPHFTFSSSSAPLFLPLLSHTNEPPPHLRRNLDIDAVRSWLHSSHQLTGCRLLISGYAGVFLSTIAIFSTRFNCPIYKLGLFKLLYTQIAGAVWHVTIKLIFSPLFVVCKPDILLLLYITCVKQSLLWTL